MPLALPALCPAFAALPPIAGSAYLGSAWSGRGSSFKARRWLVKDACGLFTASLTNFFIFGAIFVNTLFISRPLLFQPAFSLPAAMHLFVSNTLLILGVVAQWRAMLSDPGAVPQDAAPLEISLEESRARGLTVRTCRRCGTFKPHRAHHDSVSGRCVVKMDHYCPWVNNTVGFRNHKHFLLFVGYIFLASVHVLGLIAWHHSVCRLRCRDISLGGNMLIFLVAFEGVLFGLFTACMFCEQLWGVLQGQTQIDRLKGGQGKHRSYAECLVDVLGDGPRWQWPLPFYQPQWSDIEERMGFRTGVRFTGSNGGRGERSTLLTAPRGSVV
jgi:palmitoyltransferase